MIYFRWCNARTSWSGKHTLDADVILYLFIFSQRFSSQYCNIVVFSEISELQCRTLFLDINKKGHFRGCFARTSWYRKFPLVADVMIFGGFSVRDLIHFRYANINFIHDICFIYIHTFETRSFRNISEGKWNWVRCKVTGQVHKALNNVFKV